MYELLDRIFLLLKSSLVNLHHVFIQHFIDQLLRIQLSSFVVLFFLLLFLLACSLLSVFWNLPLDLFVVDRGGPGGWRLRHYGISVRLVNFRILVDRDELLSNFGLHCTPARLTTRIIIRGVDLSRFFVCLDRVIGYNIRFSQI